MKFEETDTGDPNNIMQNHNIGDNVYVKPPNATCTREWTTGTVTGLKTNQKIEVDGQPRHISEIRSVPNPTCGLLEPAREIVAGDNTRKEIEVIPQAEVTQASENYNNEDQPTTSNAINDDATSQSTPIPERPQRDRHKPKNFEDYIFY